MSTPNRSRSILAAAALLALVASRGSAVNINISATDDAIDIRSDDIVVTADDDAKARITPEGSLLVDGKRVRLTEAERQGFVHYNKGLHRIKDHAVSLGIQGAGLAFSALGEAITAIATGEPDRAERRVEARAERLKDRARELCGDMRNLQQLQDTLARSVPEFEPFAVIDLDEDDCKVED